ncbi:MAG: hypothetical protein M3Z20_16235 [Chloroflexota bacterium]|nr:hypothetical protein [Chloroflexota bacterium]
MAVTDSSLPSVVVFPSGNVLFGSDDQRCSFSRQRGRWTLQADCELSTALDLPPHVTLDGGGHTIALTGDAEGFESAAIRATGGDIVNLTVDGSQLLPIAPAYFAAIALTAPGRIAHTTVRNIQFREAPHSAIGIEVAAFDRATALVQDITLENISGAGLLLTGDNQITVERMSSTGANSAVQMNGTLTAHLSHVVVERAHVGVLAQDQSCARITASTATGERVAEDQALILQDTLIFIGAGDRERARRRAAEAAAMPADLLG